MERNKNFVLSSSTQQKTLHFHYSHPIKLAIKLWLGSFSWRCCLLSDYLQNGSRMAKKENLKQREDCCKVQIKQAQKLFFVITASSLTDLPLRKCACCVLPCTLRDVRSDSTNVYSPKPLKVKLRPSNVRKWGSPKADAIFKSKKRIKNK